MSSLGTMVVENLLTPIAILIGILAIPGVFVAVIIWLTKDFLPPYSQMPANSNKPRKRAWYDRTKVVCPKPMNRKEL